MTDNIQATIVADQQVAELGTRLLSLGGGRRGPCPYKRHWLDLGCGSYMWITWRVGLRERRDTGKEAGAAAGHWFFSLPGTGKVDNLGGSWDSSS